MKYLVTSEEMQRADRTTSDLFLLPSVVLMERAALSVADEITNRFSKPCRVCIVCGNGNNGGDGFALGRILNERGFSVHFFTFNETGHASNDNLLQKQMLYKLKMGISTGLPEDEYDIIVDAVFGIGLKREISNEYADCILHLNAMKGYKIAVDIPSGINADTGSVLGCAFCADLTVTFGFCKKGHYLYPGREYCGRLLCRDIGIAKAALEEKPPVCYTFEKKDIRSLLPKRTARSHKGTYHKVGIIAGSRKIGGAAVLSSMAAMQTGVGYTKIYSDEINRNVLLQMLPEGLFYSYEQYDTDILSDCSAVAIGPGIGTDHEAKKHMKDILTDLQCPLVIDADAINLVSSDEELKALLIKYALKIPIIMTPHRKELERFCGYELSDRDAELYRQESEIAGKYHITLVCKDAATRVYHTDGSVYINSSGNHGMAAAGSGDVLTGIIAGLTAQGADVKTASSLGVYIHGLCGDYALKKSNPYSMKASDLVGALQYVLRGEEE